MRSLPARSLFAATIALTLGLAGCAAGGGGSGDGAPRGTANRIIFEEIQPLAQLDAYQVIQRIRPNWLRSRGGTSPQVMLDGNRQPGGVETLRSLRASDLQEMRYINSSDATTRFGTGFDGGAILITSRR